MVINFSNQDLYAQLSQKKDTQDDTIYPTLAWGNLKRPHLCYDPLNIKKLDMLYHGGQEVQNNASLFAPRFGWETTQAAYQDRLAAGAYIPLISKHIDYYATMLFDVPIQITPSTETNTPVPPFYQEWVGGCDKAKQESLHHFLQKQFISSLLHHTSYTGIDVPKMQKEYRSRAQQEADGLLSPYLYHIDPKAVVDWKQDENNKHLFQQVKLIYELCVQPDLLKPPQKQLQVIFWNQNPSTKVVSCTTYLSKVQPIPEEWDDYMLLQEEDTIKTTYPHIPIICLHLHSGLAIGAKLAPLAEEHFQRRTHTNYSAYRDAIIVPTLSGGNMIPGVGQSIDPRTLNPSNFHMPRGHVDDNGVFQIGENQKFDIVEAHGHVLAFLQQQNEDLENQMARVVSQMATTNHKKQSQHAQSGQAKQEDRHEMETFLQSFAEIVRNHLQQILSFVAHHRQEELKWNIQGLQTSDYPDRQELLQEAISLTKIDINSTTFQQAYKYKISLALVDDLTDEDKAKIKEELAAPANEDADGYATAVSNQGQDQADKQNDDSSDDLQMAPNGHEMASPLLHKRAQESTSGIADKVYDQLKDDYSEDLIQWVKAANWQGPLEINMNQIDDSNMGNWDAVKNPKRQPQIKDFEQQMSETDENKPIILINLPDDSKLQLADGHGRFTAAHNINKPTITAYVAEVGSMKGEWDQMHRLQRQGEVGGKSMQSSQQISNQNEPVPEY